MSGGSTDYCGALIYGTFEKIRQDTARLGFGDPVGMMRVPSGEAAREIKEGMEEGYLHTKR
ncbi:hypothetical protein V7S43_005900 [Phytophthora oleae]|uniref:Uncharacterized protein n=1 Tax=Phytophthora oleae TaxID=2107226 RepID=A0ABD3FV08_9STRA